MKLLTFCLATFLLSLSSFAMAANDSTHASAVPTAKTHRYWSCTSTYLAGDSNSGWWRSTASGGQWGSGNRSVYCNDAGSNPSNSIPYGIAIWTYDPTPNRLYFHCAHVVPTCGWVTGTAN